MSKTGEVDASNKESSLSEKGERKIQDYKQQFGEDFDPFNDATDSDGDSFDPEKHRTHKGTNVPVLTGKGNLYRKKGKGNSSSGSSKKTDAGAGESKQSKVQGSKKTGEDDEPDRARVAAENLVDRLIATLDDDEHETSDAEREQLIQVQTEFNRRFVILEAPFLVEYPLTWGIWLKPRLIGGPGGMAGLMEMYGNLWDWMEDEEEYSPLQNAGGDEIEPDEPNEEDPQDETTSGGSGMPEKFEEE